ncbi:unnamed protein product [Parnassius apollo]|uniref:(apollo) hypothetical protein n=1 Tax=Parnassius apollo TaxID=110799 RepID=A0A8S3WVM3_PARAO|nr:unnamed protein product [Parnassius apollo]
MTTGWSNEETFKFIELCQNQPVIWNPKHKYHKDKNKVNDAWARIAEEMLVPVSEIKRKKETFFSSFPAES